MSVPKIDHMHQRVIDAMESKKDPNYVPKASTTRYTNNAWNDAEQQYQMSMNAIELVEGELLRVLIMIKDDPARLARVADQELLAANVQGITNDLHRHIERLDQIHSKHAGRSGAATSIDDNMLVLQVMSEYAEALQIYDGTIRPTYIHIIEQIGAINDMISAAAVNPQ